MNCPRCGQTNVAQPTCPRCGVIFEKLAAPRPRPQPRSGPRDSPNQPSSGRLVLALGAVLLTALGAAAWRAVRTPVAPPPASDPERLADPPTPPQTPAASSRSSPAPLPSVATEEAGLSAEDRALAEDLTRRVNGRHPVSEVDVRNAEALYSRHPEEHGVQKLLGAVLYTAGSQQAQSRRLDPALTHLRRAAGLLPGNPEPRLALLDVLSESGDWAGAEAAARDVLALEPHNPDALERLAFALFRQDRNREAGEALQQALEIRPTPFARSLLDRIRKASADESGMTEQQLSHFHVRYDGDSHEDVGREILRALERHYATLAATLDHQPVAPIPVILFSRQQYYDASGAPAWSGGVYDGLDGRIRIPIGGLNASLTPDMDQTLIHEVTHAFVSDRSRGQCPRDVNEGLAQYLEGKRIAQELTAEQLTALADGRMPGVRGFYLQALSFVEYLVGARGQGGINDLLRAMGETGDANEAFRQVYGADHRDARQAWLDRLRQQHGS